MAKTRKTRGLSVVGKHEIPTFNLEYRTESQRQYGSALQYDDIVVGVGPAGTGKTFIPSIIFANNYLQKKIKKIIITRANVECGDSIGALPGELEAKFEPWTAPITNVIKEVIGVGKFECDTKNGHIQQIPVQFLRGHTFDDASVIVDEAQNLTVAQMKMLITRIGENCTMVLCGDIKQIDLHNKNDSGLAWFVNEIRKQNTSGIEVIEFSWDDCQRSATCKKMLKLIQQAS